MASFNGPENDDNTPLPVNSGRGDTTTPIGRMASKLATNYGPSLYKEGGVDKVQFGLPQASYSNEGRGVAAPAPSNVQTAQDLGDRMSQKYFKGVEGPQKELPSFDAGQMQGKQVYNTYDPDQPASMGAKGNDPWKDMARQLANFSALRNRDQPTPGFAALEDPDTKAWNARMDQNSRVGDMQWAMKSARTPEERVAIGKQYGDVAGNALQARGQDLNYNAAIAGQGIQARGQDLNYRAHTEGVAQQGGIQREIAGIQGENQLAVARQQGANQLGHDDRAYQQALGVEDVRQNSPLATAQAEESKARSKLAGVQGDTAKFALEDGRSKNSQMDKFRTTQAALAKEGLIDATEFKRRELEHQAYLNYQEKQAKGKNTQGYAEGGRVENPDQLMARIQAKYGVSGNTPVPQPQQPPPQTPVQQPQQPQGVMDRLRNVATAGLDRRMQGYADGGPLDVSGRPVYGPGDGKSDSIPAVIDGQRPAALSTGEFVMPVEAVQHFGLDRLNKMVAAARKGVDTGR